MRNDLFSNPPPTEIPPFQEPGGVKEWEQFLAERQRAAWGCKEANAVSRVSCGQKGHMGKGRRHRGEKAEITTLPQTLRVPSPASSAPSYR